MMHPNLAPLFFAFHGHGGNMRQADRSFSYQAQWPEAVIVYPQGLPTPGQLTDPEGKRNGWRTLADDSFDIAVSQMAMMDIPDPRAMFRSVKRVLKPGGVFVFSLLHPCFEAPYLLPDEEPFLADEEGNWTAVVVRWYGREGHWQSGGDGVRGHMGAYHRMMSTYINDLITAGFRLEKLEEPLVEGGGLMEQVPKVMIVAGTAE
jgi:SAM-dependent methyltransferase